METNPNNFGQVEIVRIVRDRNCLRTSDRNNKFLLVVPSYCTYRVSIFIDISSTCAPAHNARHRHL